jgi:hypothetical protein
MPGHGELMDSWSTKKRCSHRSGMKISNRSKAAAGNLAASFYALEITDVLPGRG